MDDLRQRRFFRLLSLVETSKCPALWSPRHLPSLLFRFIDKPTLDLYGNFAEPLLCALSLLTMESNLGLRFGDPLLGSVKLTRKFLRGFQCLSAICFSHTYRLMR